MDYFEKNSISCMRKELLLGKGYGGEEPRDSALGGIGNRHSEIL